jgi:hypothetical protein
VTAKMIALKKQFPSTFNTDDFSFSLNGLVKRINLNDNVGNLDVVIVANFDVTTQSVNPNFPTTGNWYDTFSGNTLNVTNPTALLSLQPGEYRLYSQTQNLSTDHVGSSERIKIYPNPTSTRFSLNKNSNRIIIYNLTGKQVKQFEGPFLKGTPFDVSNLSQGIYLMKITNDSGELNIMKLLKV